MNELSFRATDDEKVEAMRLIFALDPEAEFHRDLDGHRDPERAVRDYAGYKALTWRPNRHSIAFGWHTADRPWSSIAAAELLAALRPAATEQPEPEPRPESWPGPEMVQAGELAGAGVGVKRLRRRTYETEIYADGRLSVGCTTLKAASVQALIAAYQQRHPPAVQPSRTANSGKLGQYVDPDSCEPERAGSSIVRVGRHRLRLVPVQFGRDAADLALCDEDGDLLPGGYVLRLKAVGGSGKLVAELHEYVNEEYCERDNFVIKIVD